MTLLKEWLIYGTEFSATVIDGIALIVILFGTLEAVIGCLRLLVATPTNHEKREVWLRYARWLVAGLTFQLAADIIETAIAPSWDDIGKLAVVALIRTFLDYFLERDVGEIRERESDSRRRTSK